MALQVDYVTVVEDRSTVSSSTFGQNRPTLQRDLSAIAELLFSKTHRQTALFFWAVDILDVC